MKSMMIIESELKKGILISRLPDKTSEATESQGAEVYDHKDCVTGIGKNFKYL